MKFRSLCAVALLLGVSFSVFAEPSVISRYPRGLGLNGGLINGVGLSYRYLPETTGYQVTGVLFKSDSSFGPASLNYSLGAGLIQPFGDFSLVSGIDVVPYAEVSAASIGSVLLPSTSGGDNQSSARLDGLFNLGLSYGLEWLLWEHLSFNFELGTAVGYEFPSNRSSFWDVRPWVAVSPQAALYFRF